MIDRIFNEHPASVGESYGEHLATAGGFGLALIGAGLACLFHGCVPALFERTGSRAIERLHARMLVNRRRALPAGAIAAE